MVWSLYMWNSRHLRFPHAAFSYGLSWVFCGSNIREKKRPNGGETCLPRNFQAICKVLLIAASFLVRRANCWTLKWEHSCGIPRLNSWRDCILPTETWRQICLRPWSFQVPGILHRNVEMYTTKSSSLQKDVETCGNYLPPSSCRPTKIHIHSFSRAAKLFKDPTNPAPRSKLVWCVFSFGGNCEASPSESSSVYTPLPKMMQNRLKRLCRGSLLIEVAPC